MGQLGYGPTAVPGGFDRYMYARTGYEPAYIKQMRKRIKRRVRTPGLGHVGEITTAYSAGAAEGKGLSDAAQRVYDRARLSKARGTTGEMETIWDILFTPEGKTRGVYARGGIVTAGRYKDLPMSQAMILHEKETIEEGILRDQKQMLKQLLLRSRGFVGEMPTRYSIHKGMPQVLADLLEESKEPGAPSGISIGKVIGVSVVGYGLWVLLT